MGESTQAPAEVRNPSGYGWCAWHQNYARGVRLVQVLEAASGSGKNLFACPTCRDVYDLTPYADQP